MDDLPQINANETALLVMDFQPGIIERVDGTGGLLNRVESVIVSMREAGVTIGYVRVALNDQERAAVPDTNKSFSTLAKGKTMDADAPETQVHERLAPKPGDIEVRKIRVGAFSTTDLEEQLRSKGIKNLILSGISTSGVVLSSVRYAADKDFRIFVLSDCVADRDEDAHRVLLENIFPRQAYVVTSNDLAKLFNT